MIKAEKDKAGKFIQDSGLAEFYDLHITKHNQVKNISCKESGEVESTILSISLGLDYLGNFFFKDGLVFQNSNHFFGERFGGDLYQWRDEYTCFGLYSEYFKWTGRAVLKITPDFTIETEDKFILSSTN